MKNKVTIFKNEQFGEIRTAGTADNPMFCLADICRVLELDTSQVMKRLEDGVVTIHPIKDKLGRTQKANFVSEDGLYDVILDSRKQEARMFRKWIVSEVLPTIRKTGGYYVQTMTALPDFTDPAEAAIAWANEYKQKRIAQQRVDELEHDNLQLAAENQELKNDKSYLDLIMRSKALLTISQIAQDYGMSGKAMNKKLQELNIQYSINGQWILYASYKDKGYVSSKSIPIPHSDGRPDFRLHTCWTQEGRKFLYEKLKTIGIIPMLERY